MADFIGNAVRLHQAKRLKGLLLQSVAKFFRSHGSDLLEILVLL